MHALAMPELLLLALVGAAAGFVNTVAGAGSLISLRALMLLGLGATEANGTNRIPVLAQSLAAWWGFSKAGKLPLGAIAWTAGPACAGALVGSVVASYVPDRPMRFVLIVVLFFVGVLGLRKPKRRADAAGAGAPAGGATEPPPQLTTEEVVAMARLPRTIAWLFFAGAYGGFLQAGVGLIILHALGTVGGLDLVRSNALKVVVVALFSAVAATVFVWQGSVVWVPALAMTVGSVVGARLAVAYAIGWAQRLKVVVVVVDLAACAVLLLQEVAG